MQPRSAAVALRALAPIPDLAGERAALAPRSRAILRSLEGRPCTSRSPATARVRRAGSMAAPAVALPPASAAEAVARRTSVRRLARRAARRARGCSSLRAEAEAAGAPATYADLTLVRVVAAVPLASRARASPAAAAAPGPQRPAVRAARRRRDALAASLADRAYLPPEARVRAAVWLAVVVAAVTSVVVVAVKAAARSVVAAAAAGDRTSSRRAAPRPPTQPARHRSRSAMPSRPLPSPAPRTPRSRRVGPATSRSPRAACRRRR